MRVLYTVVVVGLIFVGLMWVTAPFANEAGELDFKVYDESETLIIDETYPFYEDDTLFTVIDRHHDTVCADRSYNPDPSCEVSFADRGRVLLGIGDIMTDWNNTFLYLEVDGNMATRGVDNIPLRDGSTYVLQVRNAD